MQLLLLVFYNSIFISCFSLCPAWDISSAFKKLHNTHPWLDWYITRGIVNHFIKPPRNQLALSTMPEAAAQAGNATYLGEFMEAAAPLGKYLLNLAMSHFSGGPI